MRPSAPLPSGSTARGRRSLTVERGADSFGVGWGEEDLAGLEGGVLGLHLACPIWHLGDYQQDGSRWGDSRGVLAPNFGLSESGRRYRQRKNKNP